MSAPATLHTPGPWKLEDFAWTQIVSKPGNGYITRDICRLDASTMAAFEQRANARLIAAAPELLDALQLLLVAHGEQLDLAFEQAQKAIAKATGQPTSAAELGAAL